MTFRQLTYFSTIYECKSLSAAAHQLYISQQGLSRILCSLETEIGPLFVRQHNGLSPTSLGTQLYHACQPVLHEMRVLERRVAEFSRLEQHQLHIGLAGGTRYLNVISTRQIWNKQFQSHHPDIQIRAKEYSYPQALERFRQQKLDLITYSDYTPQEDCEQIDLRTWSRVLLVPEGHRLYAADTVSPAELKGERLVLYTNANAKQKLLHYCSEHDCLPADLVSVSDTLYMHDACQRENCLGLTIDSYYTAPLLPLFPHLRAIRFTEDFLPYTVSALFHTDHPMAPILRALSGALRDFFDTQQA